MRLRSAFGTVAVVAVLIAANLSVPKWVNWVTAFGGRDPARMCRDPAVVKRFTTEIQTATANLQALLEKALPKPSNTLVTVTMTSVIPLSYDPTIERVKCRINYHVETSEHVSMLASIDGIQPNRTAIYYVQPDPSGYLTVSW